MVQIHEMQFATSIGVLFTLKEANGFKTLQETYKLFESPTMDTVMEILRVSYNKQNKTNLTVEQFIDMTEDKGIGFLLLADIFQEVVEKLMFDGLSEQQVQEKRNFLESLKK